MQFGDQIKMLRDYDGGRFAEGEIYTVGMGEPEDGKVRPGAAASFCGPAADGQGSYAKKVSQSNDEDEE